MALVCMGSYGYYYPTRNETRNKKLLEVPPAVLFPISAGVLRRYLALTLTFFGGSSGGR